MVMRIPTSEDLGRRLAEPVDLARTVNPRAAGGVVGEAVAAVGGMEMRAEAQEAAQRQQQMVAEAREQEQLWKAAQRGKAMDALQTAQADLAAQHDDFADGIRTGTIAKEKAGEEWGGKTKEAIARTLEGVPVEWRQQVQRGLEADSARLTRGIIKAVSARNRDDVTASLDSILETESRNYSLDPAGAAARADAALQSLGPMSNYDPAMLGKKAQGWREGAEYTTAYAAVTGARQDARSLATIEKQLANPEFLPAMDPQRRAQLSDRVAGYRLHLDQQAELGAQRAARAAEQHLNKAKAAADAWQRIADRGTAVSPEFTEASIAATAGTPYQAVVRAGMQEVRETGGMARLPIAQQRATLDALDAHIAKAGLTPELERRREQLNKVYSSAVTDAKADPLRAGVERGVIPEGLTPLNPSAGVGGLVTQLAERTQQADAVQKWAGTDVSPMTPQEAEQVGAMFRSLPLDGQEAALIALTGAMTPRQARALAKQIDPQDRALSLAMGAGTAATTEGRSVAKLILRGQQAIKDKAIKEEAGAEFGVRASLAKEVGDVVAGPARDAVIDAARFIYLGKQAAGERVTYGGALALALGGPIVEHNGQRLPVPQGVDLPAALASYPANKMPATVYINGQPIPGEAAAKALPGAQLEAAGNGRYRVRVGGFLLGDERRQPVLIDVR